MFVSQPPFSKRIHSSNICHHVSGKTHHSFPLVHDSEKEIFSRSHDVSGKTHPDYPLVMIDVEIPVVRIAIFTALSTAVRALAKNPLPEEQRSESSCYQRVIGCTTCLGMVHMYVLYIYIYVFIYMMPMDLLTYVCTHPGTYVCLFVCLYACRHVTCIYIYIYNYSDGHSLRRSFFFKNFGHHT